MKNTDTIAGIIFLFAILASAYLWLSYEQHKIREERQQRNIPVVEKAEKVKPVYLNVKPKSFQEASKRTE